MKATDGGSGFRLGGKDLERLADLCDRGTRFLGAVKELVQLFGPLAPPAADDPYLVVGVNPGDPWELVEKVYRAKAKALHPDTKTTGNEVAYKCLQAAYATLKERRRP